MSAKPLKFPNGVNELLQASLDEHKALVKRFSTEIEELTHQLKVTQEESEDSIRHLAEEVKKQKETIVELEVKNKNASVKEEERIQKMQDAADVAMRKQANEAEEMVSRLQTENSKLKHELMELRIFRDDKENSDRIVREKDSMIEAIKQREKDTIIEMERKYLADFDRQQKLSDSKIDQIKKASKAESESQLDQESLKIRAEVAELKSLLSKTVEFNDLLQKENEKYKSLSKKFKMEFELTQQRDEEYALRGVKQSKEIKELQIKVKTLERSLSQVLADHEEEKRNWDQTYGKEMNDLKLETAGLRQLVKMKAKELIKVKKLSQIILDQRTEVEQFLLEAIDQVKIELQERRQANYQNALSEYNQACSQSVSLKSKNIFPSLSKSSRGALGPGLNLPKPPTQPGKVELRDINLEERERVLKLLFARINNHANMNAAATNANSKFEEEFIAESLTPPLIEEDYKEKSSVFLTQSTFEIPEYSTSSKTILNQPYTSIPVDFSNETF